MRSPRRVILKSLLVLFVVSVGIAVTHWLAAPPGYGASAWVEALPQLGHPTVAAMLRPITNRATVRAVSAVVERTINAPRNQLLYNIGLLYSADSALYYQAPHALLTGHYRAMSKFAAGTFLIYLPFTLGIALMVASGWQSMRKPLVASSLIFGIAAAIYTVVSGASTASKGANILMSLSILTATVGAVWSQALTPLYRRRVLTFLTLGSALIGMYAMTTSGGLAHDLLSYPIFFVWSFVVVVSDVAIFVLLVAGCLKLADRLQRDENSAHARTP